MLLFNLKRWATFAFSRGQFAARTPPRGGLNGRPAVALAVRWSLTGPFQAIKDAPDHGCGRKRATAGRAFSAVA